MILKIEALLEAFVSKKKNHFKNQILSRGKRIFPMRIVFEGKTGHIQASWNGNFKFL